MSQEHLRSWAGQEYNPCDLLFGKDRISNLTSSEKTCLIQWKDETGGFDFAR